MKQRLLVMNGQRLLQFEQAGQWNTNKVEKAGAVRPGIYDIHLAIDADKCQRYDGPVIYVDKRYVFQQVGRSFVKHDVATFERVPDVGGDYSVTYRNGHADAAPRSTRLRNRLS